MADIKNYTLGRGKVSFSRFLPGTQVPEGFLYIGNTPEFNLTIESEDLPHYSSDEGIREKDDGVTLEVTRSGSMITDNISPENVSLFFFGVSTTVTTTSSGPITFVQTAVIPGRAYRIGATATNPVGYIGLDEAGFAVREAGGTKATGTVTLSGVPLADETVTIDGQAYKFVAALAVANDVLIGGSAAASAANLNAAINGGPGSGAAYHGATVANASVVSTILGAELTLEALATGTAGNAVTLAEDGTVITVSGATLAGGTDSAVDYVLGTDYEINYDLGMITILETGAIASGDDIEIEFSTRANTRDRVISGTEAVEGAMMYIANNPKGKNFDYYMGYVNIRPNGDYALKGDEWQQIPFSLDINKPRNSAAILMDGRPVYQ